MKRKSCFFIVLALLMAMPFVVFAGGGGQTATAATFGGNPILSVTSIYHMPEAPNHAGVESSMERITGYRINYQWIPATAYRERLNTMMASDALTDIIVLADDFKTTAFMNAMRDGIFWELDNYIPDFPNLVKIGTARYDNVRRDGRIVAIPRSRVLVRHGINYRQDWAEELGFNTPPSTVDELDRLARAMKQRYGLQFSITQGINPGSAFGVPDGVLYVATWLGAPNGWGFDSNGNLIHTWLTPQFMEALDLFRTWFNDGIMNRNFIEINNEDAKGYINTEEAGIVILAADDIRSRFMDLNVRNPNARLWYSISFNGRQHSTTGFNAGLAFSKRSANTEERLRHALQWVNNLGTPEFQTIRRMGLEGEHYTIVNGVAVQSQEQLDRFARFATSYSAVNVFEDVIDFHVPLEFPANFNSLRQSMRNYDDTATTDPTTPFVSETQSRIGSFELDPLRTDAINKYIAGAITRAQLQEAQQRWLATGGAQVTREFQEQIRAAAARR